MYSVQDNDNLASFQTKEAIEGAKAFARRVALSTERKADWVQQILNGHGGCL